MRARVGLAALGVAVAAVPVAAQARTAYQPIQGAWRFEGGTVLIQPVARHRFVGIVVRKTQFGTCIHPRGQRMWNISGSVRSYTGTHLYFKKSLPCTVDRPGQATWMIKGIARRAQLRFCSAEPGTGPPTPSNPTTLCHTLPRVAVPAGLSRSCSRLSRAINLCIRGPAPLRTVGCLPRTRAVRSFTVSLTGPSASRAKLDVGPFHFGKRLLPQQGRRLGGGRRVTFSVRAAGFAPGPRLLRAVAGSGRQRHTVKTIVWVCD